MPAKPLVIACLFALHAAAAEEGWRLMAGEPGHDSVIVQARPPAPFRTAATTIAIEIANRAGFDNARYSDWQRLSPEYDFLAHIRLSDLRPATGYVYRPVVRTDTETIVGPVARFTTLPGPHRADPVRFAVVTGMHYHRFHADPDKAYTGPDKPLGYPALATLAGLKPDFVVYTGDNVYYDHPESAPATTRAELRERWRRQFAQPRYTELFLEVPGFWMKDDHDHRYDDSDRSGDRPPSHELGVATFTEQAPIAPRGGGPVRTYRTQRVTRDLQLWFVEGRDYRSDNRMPDGPEKTLWGEDQMRWLQRTLIESDAPFKLLVSPTPLIGPDDRRKRDNHSNIGGFQYERNRFFDWLGQNGFDNGGFYIVVGDRHWQYHSIHPAGFEEFASGALVDANSRLGRAPGDPRSTDPEATIVQPFTSPEAGGGFLLVDVARPEPGAAPRLAFDFRDKNGVSLYRVEKHAAPLDDEPR